MTFINNVWSGQYPLAKQYWLFFVLPAALAKVLDRTLPWDAMPDWSALPFLGLSIPIYIVGLVGVYRCVNAGRYQSRGWATAAVVVASVGALLTFLQLAEGFMSGLQAAQ
jgi:hypothetical protein